MRELMRVAREHDEAIMVLWASEGGIYQRLGFGLGTRAASVDIETAHASFQQPLKTTAPCRLIGLDEAASVLPPLYDAVRLCSPGMLARSPEWWAAYRLGDPEHERGGGGPLQCVVFGEERGDSAYALYRFHPVYERRLHHDWLEVIEAVHTSPQAARDLWHYLLDMKLVQRVRADFLQEDHPLTLMLDEPGRLRLTLSDGLWLRLIDVREALAARSYAGVGTIVLEVADPLCEWNRGCWRIEANGTDCLVSACHGPPDILLRIEDLAAVYLGAFSFMDLRHAGRLVEVSQDAGSRASALFQRSRAPWCAEVI
jgi:predicted acetyltransferase